MCSGADADLPAVGLAVGQPPGRSWPIIYNYSYPDPAEGQVRRRLASRLRNRAHAMAPRAGLCPAAPGLRPTAATGAGLTWMGPAAAEFQVTLHAAPFIRKSSVWVKQSWIGPGRSSLRTEAAARRSQSSTWHIIGDWMVTPPVHTIRRRTCSLSFFSRRFSLSDFDGFLDIALRGDLSAMSAPFPLKPHYFPATASGPWR